MDRNHATACRVNICDAYQTHPRPFTLHESIACIAVLRGAVRRAARRNAMCYFAGIVP